MTDNPYASAARLYRAAGWLGTLPIPYGRKAPPPPGWTGRAGPLPSEADVAAWLELHGPRNIAIRLPRDVIGLDVDGYDGRPGLETLAALEGRCGQLPATWRSTARPGGQSGIRYYRLPEGITSDDWPNTAGTGIDIIRHTHRYAMVWPSLHPNGGTYVWLRPDDDICLDDTADHIPPIDMLPELPAAWVSHMELLAQRLRGATVGGLPHDDVFAGERRFTQDEAREFVRPALEALADAPIGQINQALNDAAKTLSHFGDEFWGGGEATKWLREALRCTRYDGKTWKASDTIASAYRSAAHDWKAVLASESAAEATEEGFGHLYLTVGDLDSLPTPEPLIDGVLDQHALFVVSGRGDTFKSFLTFDWLACIATGQPWQGHEVKQSKCLLVVGEGAYGLAKRRDAWQESRQVKIPDEALHIRRMPVNLFRGGSDYADLLERVAAEGYEVILFDTLQRMTSGGESNSARDAGIVFSRLGELRSAADGTVGVVAHGGKADSAGVRGSSAWEDDADIVWRVRRPENGIANIVATLGKRKDGPEGLEFRLQASEIAGSLVLHAASEDPFRSNLPPSAGEILLLLGGSAVPEDGLSASEIRGSVSVGREQVRKVLGMLIDAGKVRITGSGRSTRYAIKVVGDRAERVVDQDIADQQ